jgi:hypothetical protein
LAAKLLVNDSRSLDISTRNKEVIEGTRHLNFAEEGISQAWFKYFNFEQNF